MMQMNDECAKWMRGYKRSEPKKQKQQQQNEVCKQTAD